VDQDPQAWSATYEAMLSQNVEPGLLPARRAYLTVTELESKVSGGFNSYDQ
jgi:hypothetical protein